MLTATATIPPKKKKYPRMVAALIETFGFNPTFATILVLLLALFAAGAILWFVHSAPPRTIVITTGPAGGSFQRYAGDYAKLLAKEGVTLRILPSQGSLENLTRLKSGEQGVDIGFVIGGVADATEPTALAGLESLGSVAHQPLWIFYRGKKAYTRLSELTGLRLAIGAPGSGTRAIVLTLLNANGITAAQANFLDLDAEAAASALQEGKIDAAFLMGDSAPSTTLRTLVRSTDIQLFHVAQADAYVRRHTFLDRIELPQGSIDLGKNLPVADVVLVGPTVELVVRKGLHPALCDVLLEVAKEVHGKASLLQKRGEFPAPLEHEFTLSEDALRYYKSGKGFVYRTIEPFWVANVVNRVLVVFVPALLVLIPAIRFLPFLYRLTIQLRIIRCYRPLLQLERELNTAISPDQLGLMLDRLDEVEASVNELKVPASFGDQFYVLRVHVAFMRERLKSVGGARAGSGPHAA